MSDVELVQRGPFTSTPEFVQRGASIRKPGPKPDPLRAEVRAMFPEWSDRTFATYWRGMKSTLELVSLGLVTGEYLHEMHAGIIDRVATPSGEFSVTAFTKECENAARSIREKVGGERS